MIEEDLVQALLDAVAAGDDERAEEAARACVGHPGILPALRPLLADPDADRRWWATRALATVGSPEGPRLLAQLLGDPDEGVRCVAALGLGNLKAAPAVPALAACLADASGFVRESAADALAIIGEPAVPALVEAMSDPREGVRVRAASALRRIAVIGPRPGPNLDIHSPRGQAIGALFRALQDPNYLVHQHAYTALDQMGLLDNLIVM